MTNQTKTFRRLMIALVLVFLFFSALHLCLCSDEDCALCPALRTLLRACALALAAHIRFSAPRRLCPSAGSDRLCLPRDTLVRRGVLLRC